MPPVDRKERHEWNDIANKDRVCQECLDAEFRRRPFARIACTTDWTQAKMWAMGAHTVFHLAALARVQPSFDNPAKYLKNNVSVTADAVQFAIDQRCKFVYAGSSTCDGEPTANPYAMSKHLGEQVCRAYGAWNSTFRHWIARIYSAFGPGQPKGECGTLIGKYKRAKLFNEDLIVSGDGSQRRDWTYIDDVCHRLMCVPVGSPGGVRHLGNGQSMSVSEIAQAFGCPIKHVDRPPGEMDATLSPEVMTRPKVEVLDYIRTYCDAIDPKHPCKCPEA